MEECCRADGCVGVGNGLIVISMSARGYSYIESAPLGHDLTP